MSRGAARISIVVPVFDVAEYLPACLDSILRQSFRDVEVIVVDDASPDDSAAIAAGYAGADPRVRVVRLPANVGLGPARNAGTAAATAPYLMFVDSDDLLAPGALERVAFALETSPDVVQFGFARTYPDGRTVPDPTSARWLAPAADLSARDRPELFKIIPSAWNKAYRREFVDELGLTFPPGMYEDIPWTFPVLMAARTIVTVPEVGYLYRQRESASLLRSSGLRHLDIVEQYGRVFAFLDAHPQYESWRPLIVDRMAWHVPTVLETTARIPPADRRAFFAAAVEGMRAHRPAGYRPAGRLGLKVRLLEQGGYRLFRVAQLVNRARRRVARRGRA